MVRTVTTFEEHLTSRYGEIGTKNRDNFERRSKAFIIGELIKDERKRAKLTQGQLAEKAGTKKVSISRIEKGDSDVQLNTLFKIIEQGLGKKLNFRIE